MYLVRPYSTALCNIAAMAMMWLALAVIGFGVRRYPDIYHTYMIAVSAICGIAALIGGAVPIIMERVGPNFDRDGRFIPKKRR